MASLAIDHLTKIFTSTKGERVCAVDRFSLAVHDGELLVLVGPSGCGKTTTLRLVAGLEVPTSGTISLDGSVVNQVPARNRDIAMVFQGHALYPHLTVFENMALGLKLRGYAAGEIEQRVSEVAELLELSGCLKRLPRELSGGQRQRVAVARAVVRRPSLCLFDEPLSDLDASLRAQLRGDLARLHARLGATVLHVTHDQSEALTLGRRVAVMRAGAIQQVADPLTIYQHPANLFVAGFIGSPPMNFFRGALVSHRGQPLFVARRADAGGGSPGFSLRLGARPAAAASARAGGDVVLGLRPENIRLARPGDPADECVEAVVEKTQFAGPESHVHVTVGSHACVAREDPGVGLSPREKCSLHLDPQAARLFDASTGEAISGFENAV
jgi:multiple sugar transport system ATP-binding protein